MVLMGDGEPDLTYWQGNTPPPPPCAAFVFAGQLFASSATNKRARWHLATGDVEGAFLQGAHDDHSPLLYMVRTRDPLLEATRRWQEFELAEITGNMYGRVNPSGC